MRRIIYFALPLLLSACSKPVQQAAVPPKKGPHLEVSNPVIEFGTLKTEDSHDAVIEIRNSGTEPLKISEVAVGCGCTKPQFPSSVGPGESAKISIVFDPELLWHGDRTDKVTIKSNDADQPEFVVKLQSRLSPPLSFSKGPPLIDTYDPEVRQTIDLTANARDVAGAPLKSVVSEDPRLSATLANTATESNLKLTVGAGKECGDIIAKLRLKTSIPSLPEADYFVTLQAKSGPVSSPATFRIPGLPGGAPKELGNLTIYSRSNPIKVISVKSDDTALKVTAGPADKSGRTILSVSYAGGWKSGKHVGKFTVRTDSVRFPVLEIPYLFDNVY